MNTVRTLIHTDPESSRMVQLHGDDLIILLDGAAKRFPESHEFTILENLDFLVDALSQLKHDLEFMVRADEK